MKNTEQGHEEGNAKEEGRSKHQHKHTLPGAVKPWKGKRRETRRPTETEQKPTMKEGGWKRLSQPTTAKPTST